MAKKKKLVFRVSATLATAGAIASAVTVTGCGVTSNPAPPNNVISNPAPPDMGREDVSDTGTDSGDAGTTDGGEIGETEDDDAGTADSGTTDGASSPDGD